MVIYGVFDIADGKNFQFNYDPLIIGFKWEADPVQDLTSNLRGRTRSETRTWWQSTC
jgi:hypothetical protein